MDQEYPAAAAASVADDAGHAGVVVEDLDRQGRGVARIQGQVVFVQGALPGDRVRLAPLPRRRGQREARMLQLLEPSPQRRRPPCILADHCGGCSLQPFAATAQQQWKQRLVEQTLRRIGGLELTIAPLIPAPEELGYRNRAIIPLERKPDGRLRAGYYRRGSHMNHCPVLDPRLDALIEPLKADLEATDWPVDRQGNSGGGLRHLALRVGQHSGELLITLIASQRLDGAAELAAPWMARWPDLVGVTLNLQPTPTNLLFGSETHLLTGRAWLLEQFAGLDLAIASDTFFQVNTLQAERLVPLLRHALEGLSGPLVDAYAGIGTFSLPLAGEQRSVLGIEQHPGAVELANANARRNGLERWCRYDHGDVAALLAEQLEGGAAVLLDPPRKGLERAVVDCLLACPPPRILYLSCDPGTLARDLALLCASGYQPLSVQPIDFFPNTSHVETLAVLERIG
jgi:23S rRNA (uracil1939-C5)-methyltransferase